MVDFIFKFILLYFRDIVLYFSLIMGVLILLTLFFIIKNKSLLMKRLQFVLNNNIILFIILLSITFFLLSLLVFCIFSFILYWFYIIYYNIDESSTLVDLIDLFIIYDEFNEINILIIYIIFILSYITNLIWFYYIFIYKNEDKEFVHLFNVFLYILYLVLISSIVVYNIDTAYAMFENNKLNMTFRVNLKDFMNFNIIPLNKLENQNLLLEAIKFKCQIITDNKEAVFCYNNKNELYEINLIKNLNLYKRTSLLTYMEYQSEFINNENCHCIGIKFNYKNV